MSVVSFQGAILLKTKMPSGWPPAIYLPKANVSTHLDTKGAQEHYSRIWVANGAIQAMGRAVFRSDPSGKGSYFDLDGGAANGAAYEIAVENGGGTPVDTSELKKHLFQFSRFAPGIGAPKNPSKKSTARIPLGVGSLSFEMTPSNVGPWTIDSTLGGTQQLAQIAYDIRWTIPAVDATKPIRLSVRSGGAEVTWIEVKPTSTRGQIIIGNLDDSNPGTWRNRPKVKTWDCKDEAGKQDDRCPDLDFKWLYRLYDHGTVRSALKGKALPVPKRAGAKSISPMSVGLETPTCFPGTD